MTRSSLTFLVLSIGLVVGLAACGDEAAASAPAKPTAAAAAKPASTVWLTDLAEAKRQAAARKVPILADFTGSDWCGWCKRLDAEVFSTPEFATWAAKNVVLLTVDFPHDVQQSAELQQQNTQLAEKYRVDGFPTILFLSDDGTVLAKTGYQEGGPAAWIAQVEGELKR